MSKSLGLRRQIFQSLAVMTFGIMFLSVVGSYIFYALAMTYIPGSISESWMPSRVELVWILSTLIAAFSMALLVAVRLSRRILTPLNSVAASLRNIAQGKLDARASMDQHAIGETAQLVCDFNAMAEQLQQMTRERQFWNAAIAHELRTPVTILRGRLQGLTEGVFSPSPELFASLLRQVEGLNHLIEDLRVLSLNDSGHLELQWSEVELATDISSVLTSFAPALTAKGFVLQPDLAAGLQVHCDPLRIRQALIALLDNALRHATPGLLTIRLQATTSQYQLCVEDSGPGIPADASSTIFEAFRRLDPSRSRQSGGSGLGLAVVKAIAIAHGGDASCQATATGGTQFMLAWPAQIGAATQGKI